MFGLQVLSWLEQHLIVATSGADGRQSHPANIIERLETVGSPCVLSYIETCWGRITAYRRRCCRTVMLSGSRRRDESNATASTCSFFFIKLPRASRQESEHAQRFTRRCVEADHCIWRKALKLFTPTSGRFEEAQGKKKQKKNILLVVKNTFLKVQGKCILNVNSHNLAQQRIAELIAALWGGRGMEVWPECIGDKRKPKWPPV